MCSFHTCEVGVTMVRISHGRVGIPRRTPGTPKSAWPAVNTAWRAGRKRGARAGRRSEQGARRRPAEDDRRRPTPAGTPRAPGGDVGRAVPQGRPGHSGLNRRDGTLFSSVRAGFTAPGVLARTPVERSNGDPTFRVNILFPRSPRPLRARVLLA